MIGIHHLEQRLMPEKGSRTLFFVDFSCCLISFDSALLALNKTLVVGFMVMPSPSAKTFLPILCLRFLDQVCVELRPFALCAGCHRERPLCFWRVVRRWPHLVHPLLQLGAGSDSFEPKLDSVLPILLFHFQN